MSHIPVLLQEILTEMQPKSGEVFVDCTFNRAGHSIAIAEKIGKEGTVIGLDLDHHALEEGRSNISTLRVCPTVHTIETNFRFIQNALASVHISTVDLLLADLGVSSQEIDSSGRGFTFQKDEPLIMTLSTRVQEVTAYTVVNEWTEDSLVSIMQGFSDERYARRIARAIVEQRGKAPITSTRQLREIIFQSVPVSYRHGKIDPSTKTFQAIRMAVNDEVGALQDLLRALVHITHTGSRVAFITFHSVEDRIVKHFFRDNKAHWQPTAKKPIAPSDDEIQKNPRARSAKLRVYTRL